MLDSSNTKYTVEVFKGRCPEIRWPLTFFNTADYWLDKLGTAWYSLVLFENQEPKGLLNLHINKNTLISPVQATYAGIELMESGVRSNELLKELKSFAHSHQVETLKITQPPEWFLYSSEVRYQLLQNGFVINNTDLNYHIPVTGDKLETRFGQSQQWRLKKCQEAGFTFQRYLGDDYQRCFDFIKACRERKGYPLTLSEEMMEQMLMEYPDRYFLFEVVYNNERIALALCVNVGRGIFYYYHGADADGYESFSPTVMLIEGIYRYCQENKFSILDLGIATEDGVRNEGLITFKKNMGGVETEKNTYVKTLMEIS